MRTFTVLASYGFSLISSTSLSSFLNKEPDDPTNQLNQLVETNRKPEFGGPAQRLEKVERTLQRCQNRLQTLQKPNVYPRLAEEESELALQLHDVDFDLDDAENEEADLDVSDNSDLNTGLAQFDESHDKPKIWEQLKDARAKLRDCRKELRALRKPNPRPPTKPHVYPRPTEPIEYPRSSPRRSVDPIVPEFDVSEKSRRHAVDLALPEVDAPERSRRYGGRRSVDPVLPEVDAPERSRRYGGRRSVDPVDAPEKSRRYGGPTQRQILVRKMDKQ